MTLTIPAHTATTTRGPRRGALYCRSTGRRLSPRQGDERLAGSPVAVVVLDDGTTAPIMGDTLVGRMPTSDQRFSRGAAAAIVVEDPGQHISRCHLLLRISQWDVQVIDLGSRNGTWVLDEHGDWNQLLPGIAHHTMRGQAIRFGMRCLTLHHLQRDQETMITGQQTRECLPQRPTARW